MSTLKVNSIEPAVPGSEDYFLARAWANINGSGVAAIAASGNVSSLTDNGTGDFTITFNNAMSTSTFSVAGSSGNITTGHNPRMMYPMTKATTWQRVGSGDIAAIRDDKEINVVAFE